MEKSKRDLGVDRNGVPKMMRKRDYLADMSGQIGMNLSVSSLIFTQIRLDLLLAVLELSCSFQKS